MSQLDTNTARLEATLGEEISKFARRLIEHAMENAVDTEGDFNGITLSAGKDGKATERDLVGYYHNESKRRAEEYRNSPEGQQAAKEAEHRLASMQWTADLMVGKLDQLDFSDFEAVIDWCTEFQTASDHVGVSYDRDTVVRAFVDHGYMVNANVGDDFDGENEENFAKYLVGQALDGIQTVGAPHQVLHHFAEQWKAKFRKETSS